MNSDASAAVGMSNEIGSGKVRRIVVTQIWLQEKVSQKVIVLRKGGERRELGRRTHQRRERGVDSISL